MADSVAHVPEYATVEPQEPTIDRLLRPATDPDAIITLFPSSLGARPYTRWEAVEWLGSGLTEDDRVRMRQGYGQWTLRELLTTVDVHNANCAANLEAAKDQLQRYAAYPPLHRVQEYRDTLAKIVAYSKKPGPISKATLQRILADPTWTSEDQ